jgi:hypothetical protein
LGYFERGGEAEPLLDGARRVLLVKGTGSHDYKFGAAVLEDYKHVSPAWRDRYLAACMFILRGSGDRDSELLERTRAAVS